MMRSVKIQLLEKERGNSGRDRTIKKIPSYTTHNNAKQRQRERGGGEREKREIEKIGVVTADYSSSILPICISKVKVKNLSSFVHICPHMLISAHKL